MPYFIIFYVPDYQYLPKNKKLINNIDPNKTKKNKSYVTLMKEWEYLLHTEFTKLDTTLMIDKNISIYFLKYGDRYNLPYKFIIRDINKIKSLDYKIYNTGFISHVPIDYFAIVDKRDRYLLERFTGNLLQNFDKKIKGITCSFNKFTIQLFGDSIILASIPELITIKSKLKNISIENKWHLKKNEEIFKDILKVENIKRSDFIVL